MRSSTAASVNGAFIGSSSRKDTAHSAAHDLDIWTAQTGLSDFSLPPNATTRAGLFASTMVEVQLKSGIVHFISPFGYRYCIGSTGLASSSSRICCAEKAAMKRRLDKFATSRYYNHIGYSRSETTYCIVRLAWLMTPRSRRRSCR